MQKELYDQLDKLDFSYLEHDQNIIKSIIKNIHENITNFINSLTNKKYTDIEEIKIKLNEEISSLSYICKTDIDIKIIVEKILLSSIKLIKNNHYDSFNIIASIKDDLKKE